MAITIAAVEPEFSPVIEALASPGDEVVDIPFPTVTESPTLVPAVTMTWKSSASVTSLKARLDPADRENAPPVTETA